MSPDFFFPDCTVQVTYLKCIQTHPMNMRLYITRLVAVRIKFVIVDLSAVDQRSVLARQENKILMDSVDCTFIHT